MSRPLIAIHNVQTDERIVREMNDDEYTVWLQDQEAASRTNTETSIN